METVQREHFHFVKVSDRIVAAVAPAEELDLTDAGLMNNFSNAGMILSGGGLIADTAFDLPSAKELRSFFEEATGHAPEYVVNTHGHWDHFWGNQVFEDAKILGHRDMLKDCAGDKRKVPLFKLLQEKKGIDKVISALMTKSYKDYLPEGTKMHFVVRRTDHDFDLSGVKPLVPDTLFDKKVTLQLGDLTAELLPFGAVHSSSDTVVWIPEEKVLLAGDIFADCSIPMTEAAMEKWLAVLDYILDELQPAVIVPGHGEIYTPERAESQRAYFRAIKSQFDANYNDTITEEELLQRMDLSQYIDHRPRVAWVMTVKNFFSARRKKK